MNSLRLRNPAALPDIWLQPTKIALPSCSFAATISTAAQIERVSTPASKYERLIALAKLHYASAEWELAENALKDADFICRSEGFPDSAQCQLSVMILLAEVTRRHGRYDEAVKASQKALKSNQIDKVTTLSVLGELGVCFRHMDKIEEATETFQKQYDQANRLALEVEANACRAAGNLGMTLYQLYMQQDDKSDKTRLQKSIHLLLEDRVEKSRALQKKLRTGDGLLHKLKVWEGIGVGRLSLLYAANGEYDEAVRWGKLSMEMAKDGRDPTTAAFSRFLYGYALLNKGDEAEARREFNLIQGKGRCTPAIALCKELSAEHRGYLEVLIRADVDLTGYDQQGYSALDYAVYASDTEAINILRRGLSRQIDDPNEVDSHYKMALLRKHFREIFHAQFRPIINLKRTDTLQVLRSKYEQVLDDRGEDGNAKRQRFERLRFIALFDFERHGRLPRFGMQENLTKTFREITSTSHGEERNPFVIFISYRWLGRDADPNNISPDDPDNTQYHRIISAIKALLDQQSDVKIEDVYLWLDCACIDQENLEPGRKERGINSLPIFVAQCDAMISLFDNHYLTRAWCGVEVLIMQTLRQSSQQHKWYVHTLHDHPANNRVDGVIERGEDTVVQPSGMQLTHESDRRNIEFLERQSMLLGTAASGD